MLTMYSQEIQDVGRLEGVLEEYAELFKEASELPPPRRHDHAIVRVPYLEYKALLLQKICLLVFAN